MSRAQNADTHALKQHRLSQNFPLSAPVMYWLSHLTCILSLKAKNVDFHTANNVLIQTTLFWGPIFRQFLINSPPTYLLQSDLWLAQLSAAVSGQWDEGGLLGACADGGWDQHHAISVVDKDTSVPKRQYCVNIFFRDITSKTKHIQKSFLLFSVGNVC